MSLKLSVGHVLVGICVQLVVTDVCESYERDVSGGIVMCSIE